MAELFMLVVCRRAVLSGRRTAPLVVPRVPCGQVPAVEGSGQLQGLRAVRASRPGAVVVQGNFRWHVRQVRGRPLRTAPAQHADGPVLCRLPAVRCGPAPLALWWCPSRALRAVPRGHVQSRVWQLVHTMRRVRHVRKYDRVCRTRRTEVDVDRGSKSSIGCLCHANPPRKLTMRCALKVAMQRNYTHLVRIGRLCKSCRITSCVRKG